MTISDNAIKAIKGNSRIIGRLMVQFNRVQKSIENWCDNKDVRLTTPDAVKIISEETGLNESEILEEVVTQM